MNSRTIRRWLSAGACIAFFCAAHISVAGAGRTEFEILFANDRYSLTADAKKTLDEAAQELKLNPDVKVTIEGHTSTPGARDYNQALGMKRAKAALDYLVRMHLLPAERFETVSYGEDKPKNRDITEAQQALNRRSVVISFKIEVTAILYRTVIDADGNFIDGLGIADFEVREDGVRRKIMEVHVESTTPPASVTLLLDRSGSMTGSTDDVREEASRIIAFKKIRDEMMLISFGPDMRVLEDFGSDPEKLDRAIPSFLPSGNTRLYDAMVESAEMLGGRGGARVLILISDGVDERGFLANASRHTLNDAITALKTNNVTAHTIGLGRKANRAILGEISAQTGGVSHSLQDADRPADFYKKLARGILRGKYQIVFKTDRKDQDRGKMEVSSWRGRVTEAR